MDPIHPIQRLSPKNQVTLPREARSFAGDVQVVRALASQVPSPRGDERFPIVLLMSEGELQRKETIVSEDRSLSEAVRIHHISMLNRAATLHVDAQHRVVLPAHLVSHLALDRDIFFITTNRQVQAWNPVAFARYEQAPLPAEAPELSRFLF